MEKDLLTLYMKFYNKFEETVQSCSDCPFEKQCITYANSRGIYICDDLEYLMEILMENISNKG